MNIGVVSSLGCCEHMYKCFYVDLVFTNLGIVPECICCVVRVSYLRHGQAVFQSNCAILHLTGKQCEGHTLSTSLTLR